MEIAIITNPYPYLGGEQFLETEMKFWQATAFNKVTVLPLSAAGSPRVLPAGIQVDLSLASRRGLVKHGFLALFSQYFVQECVHLRQTGKISVVSLVWAWKMTVGLLVTVSNLVSWLKRNPSVNVIYSYWNNYSSYAACVAKRRGLISKVVSRCHGWDLYEERRPHQYMPLKRQFANDFDAVFVLSEEAKSYMIRRYGTRDEKVEVMPLGVSVPSERSEPTGDGEIHLVSVSSCIHVKRIDKVISGLNEFARQSPSLQIRWTHIGAGPLQEDLETLASRIFTHDSNVSFEFKGAATNEFVNRFYLEEKVDFFINTSESEGIPVSIMEAMAAGVPAVAPDIGGISDLVSNDCGFLLPSSWQVEHLLHALKIISRDAKIPGLRLSAKRKVEVAFNASLNYPQFIKRLEKL